MIKSMKKGTALLCAALLLLTLAAGCGKKAQEEDTSGLSKEEIVNRRPAVVNDEIVEELMDDFANMEPTPPGYYEVKMNSTWNFPNGSSQSSNAYVENVETNSNDVYFDVVLTDGSETIYESPLLPLGTHLDKITLMRPLEKGTYDATLTYHLVDEEQRTLYTLDMGLTLVVEN